MNEADSNTEPSSGGPEACIAEEQEEKKAGGVGLESTGSCAKVAATTSTSTAVIETEAAHVAGGGRLAYGPWTMPMKLIQWRDSFIQEITTTAPVKYLIYLSFSLVSVGKWSSFGAYTFCLYVFQTLSFQSLRKAPLGLDSERRLGVGLQWTLHAWTHSPVPSPVRLP